MLPQTDPSRAAVIVIVTIAVIFLALVGSSWAFKALGTDMRLPLLVISGLVALIGMLAVMAIAFKTVHLANQTQALGLPDGTVRAVIALSLILIFAVVTVYLFSDLASEGVRCCEKDSGASTTNPPSTSTTPGAVTRSAFTVALLQTPPLTTPGGLTTPGSVTTTPGSLTTPGNVSGSNTPQPSADRAAAHDFAKQLLIMLGTLITSITSFYFASKTAADATANRGEDATPPKIDSIQPPTAPPNGAPIPVTALGSGLLTVNRVTLSGNGSTVEAIDVVSGETQVQFKVPANTAKGKWDVIVRTRSGRDATLAQGFEIQ